MARDTKRDAAVSAWVKQMWALAVVLETAKQIIDGARTEG
jgi:hypothetical protein